MFEHGWRHQDGPYERHYYKHPTGKPQDMTNKKKPLQDVRLSIRTALSSVSRVNRRLTFNVRIERRPESRPKGESPITDFVRVKSLPLPLSPFAAIGHALGRLEVLGIRRFLKRDWRIRALVNQNRPCPHCSPSTECGAWKLPCLLPSDRAKCMNQDAIVAERDLVQSPWSRCNDAVGRKKASHPQQRDHRADQK